VQGEDELASVGIAVGRVNGARAFTATSGRHFADAGVYRLAYLPRSR